MCNVVNVKKKCKSKRKKKKKIIIILKAIYSIVALGALTELIGCGVLENVQRHQPHGYVDHNYTDAEIHENVNTMSKCN